MNKKLHNKIKVKYFLPVLATFFVSANPLCMVGTVNAAPKVTKLAQVDVNKLKVTADLKDRSLENILRTLGAQTKLEYVFHNSVKMDGNEKFSLQVKDMPVKEALDLLLKGSKYAYRIENNKILIVNAPQIATQPQSKEKVKVAGKVLDQNNSPVVGATVMVQGTTTGAITDDKGAFVVDVNKNSNLEVSFIGFLTLVRNITQPSSNLILKLSPDVLAVEDVVVTGYQEIKKTRMTGSVETVTSKDIANKGFTSVQDILKGQMAGVTTMSISGRPGASAEVRIRGLNSITGSSDPMWIVDGMPLQGDVPSISMGGTEFQESVLTNGIGNIPPDDIESITILKDAAATAIYGARAANGVIVIKTKRGTVGKSNIRVQASYALSEAPENRLQMMNTSQKIAFERSVYEDFPGAGVNGRIFQLLKNADYGTISRTDANKEIERLSNINTDWFKEIFRIAQSQNYAMTLSGGDEKTQYYGSLSYLGEQGVMPNNYYENIGGSLKLTHDFNKRLRINFDVRSTVKNDKTTGSSVNPLSYAVFANPYERPYDEAGNYDYDRSYSSAKSTVKDGYKYDFNLLKDLNENTSKSRYLSNQMTLKLEIKILEGLMLTSMGTYSISNSSSKRELVPGSYSSKVSSWLASIYSSTADELPDEFNLGKLNESQSKSSSWTIRNQLEFARGFKDETHYVNVLLGQETTASKGDGFASMMPEWNPTYETGSYPNVSKLSLNSSALSALGSHNENQDRSVSFFLTGSYSYKDRYVVAASARLDGADIIGTSNRFSPLWNVSGKWNIHNEKFMRNVTFINQLAFRASYGYTGSIDRNVLPFSTLSIKSSSAYNGNPIYGGEKVMNVYSPGQPSVKWQLKEDINIGFDASLANSKVNLVINYYDNEVKNVIGTNYVAMSSGYRSLKANLASIKNSGWEVSVKTMNISTRNFSWITSFNIAINKNVITDTEIKSLDDIGGSRIMNRSYLNSTYVKGYSSGARFAYEFAGIDEATGGTLVYVDGYDENGQRLGSLYKDGRYVYNLDLVGTPRSSYVPDEYAKASRQFIGDTHPPVNGGFSTTLNYKRVSLSANFSFYTGHIISSYMTQFEDIPGISSLYTPYLASTNALPDELNRWRKPGDVTNVAKYEMEITGRSTFVTDRNFEKGNFLKCTNVSVGYNCPDKLCQKLMMSSLRLTFNAANLFTVTKYRGIDPETKGAFGYPSARRYNFALSVSF